MDKISPQKSFDEIKDQVSKLSLDRRWAMACYIPAVNIVACALTSVAMVQSEFCRFHARQGLVLFGLWFLTIFVGLISPELNLMLWGVLLVLHLAGMIYSFMNKIVRIPIIASFADLIPEYYVYELLTGKKAEKSKSNII
ncbi:hypothetical protein KJ632_00935 [Patescibacteria group bacterium]|nr:hypothetical protein [Patescibacteria group bacterium]